MNNFWQTLKKPITALAPMEDVTDFVFREIVATTAKPDVLYTEFTSTDALFTSGHDKESKKLLFSDIQRPIVAQVWGATPENFGRTASYIEELGFDGIDINMGCPDKAVMKKNSGAALINNQQIVEQIITEIRKVAPNLALSVKTRLDKDRDLTKDWLTFLLSMHIDTLTLHGRTAKAMSRGNADWDEIGKAVELRNKLNPKVIVLGNGDVKSYKEIIERHDIYGVDGVMVGRGIFQNPWIFEKDEITHTRKDYLDLLTRHSKLFHEEWGNEKNFVIMKKFVKMYVRGFEGDGRLRHKLMLSKNYEEFSDIISTFKG